MIVSVSMRVVSAVRVRGGLTPGLIDDGLANRGDRGHQD